MALDETGTRIADFELLDLDDPDQQTFQVNAFWNFYFPFECMEIIVWHW